MTFSSIAMLHPGFQAALFIYIVKCVCFQALAEQQKAQQLAQQQTGAPQVQAAPTQTQTPAAGQAQTPQNAAVAGAAAVTNAAVLVRIKSSFTSMLVLIVRSGRKDFA